MKYWLIKGSRIWGRGEEIKGIGWRERKATRPQPPSASVATSHLGKEFNLLLVRGLFHSSTADHGLWRGKANRGHGGFDSRELRVF